ncbi:hybrid sensor histidine kinase/response regulator transcription factor [Filimonas effusa]|uniref:hybrid sensor histidine kinase/response regulator transcription factor n=1 Tax=Filimonas effusa TaxID=2508721 RepID=UPI0013E9066F|nr:two-component regulator propeller domain-containing protein [Filimonas effusa]
MPVLFCSAFSQLHAQPVPLARFLIQKLDNKNGLSNSSVNFLYNDADNLLWVATWDGLNRYDGSSFHVFNYGNTGSSSGIGNNVARFITEDKRGNLWVSTIEGISRFNKTTGAIRNYFYGQYQRSNIGEQEFQLTVDTAGTVYCFTQHDGLLRYDVAADTFRLCVLPRHPSGVTKMAFDRSNRLWLLNNAGILEAYQADGWSFNAIRHAAATRGINSFFLLNDALFYVDAGNQLYRLSGNARQTTRLLTLPAGITAMSFYKEHYLLAWANRGFAVYDAAFQSSSFLAAEVQQMQHIRITSWCKGPQQILWYGTDGNGIIKVSPATKPFVSVAMADNNMPYNRAVRSFCKVNGSLWIGTKGGGIIEMPDVSAAATGIGRRYYSYPASLDNNAVYVMKEGHDGLVYIGTDGAGIGLYDKTNRRFIKWSEVSGTKRFPAFGSVYAVLPDKDSSVWLGTSGFGLVHLKLTEQPGKGFAVKFIAQYTSNNSKNGVNGPANDIIYALAEDRNNNLWVGCRYGGLSLMNKKSRSFTSYKAFTYEGSLSNNDVLSLYYDNGHRLWIGTSYGLNALNENEQGKAMPVFNKLTTDNGLPNNTIHAIQEDAAGAIWVSTNRGLARVSPAVASGTPVARAAATVDPANSSAGALAASSAAAPMEAAISYYQQADGLHGNEFADGAVYRDAAGYLLMGGVAGFSYFHPAEIKNTDDLPNLVLANRRIGEVLKPDDSYSVIHPSGSTPGEYVLQRKEGFIEMEVRAVSFFNAEKCKFTYLLEGYDKIWHEETTPGKIIYTNLPPGNYKLKLKWSNGEGQWSQEVTAMQVTVKQYPWLSLPALIAYVLLFLWGAYAIYRYRRNRMLIRNELELEHRMRLREEELHQQRLGFFTNIAHELQTPLTLILGSAERSMEKDRSRFMSVIHQQAARLTYLVQQLLDFRKAEADVADLKYGYCDISELLHNLAAPFVPLAEQQEKTYRRQIDEGISGWMDKDKLEKIVFNLLSNAFRHSPPQATVLFVMKRTGARLDMMVSNSGCHMLPEQMDKLFTGFYSGSAAGSTADKFGTGIGLAFTQQLVTMLQGAIHAECNDDIVTFHVQLPLVNRDDHASAATVSEHPSLLYRSVTAWHRAPQVYDAGEQNKRTYLTQVVGDEDRKQLLIVEDDADIRYLLRDLLQEHYNMYEAVNGTEAIAFLQKHTPDLIISDIMMPDMDGLELCRRVKEAPATCQIPFILLSAKDSMEHQTQGYEVGADAYIAKPFHTAHLLVRIRKLLEYRERTTEIFRDTATLDLESSGIPDADKAFIDSVVAIVEAALDDVELNAARLEKELAMSKMQLYRKIKTLSGMTPGEFIKNIRLRHAAHMLATTQLTVSEIFYRTGFNSQSYFYREFKKRYDLAPNDYRAQQSAIS